MSENKLVDNIREKAAAYVNSINNPNQPQAPDAHIFKGLNETVYTSKPLIDINTNFKRLNDGSYEANTENFLGSYGNEERLAQQQSSSEKWLNGLGKMVTKAGTYAADATAGTLVGLYQGAVDGSWDAVWNNDFSKKIDDLNTQLDGALPNYYSEAEKNMSLWNSLGTVNFWANDFGNGLAFVGGNLLSGGITSLATGGLKMSTKLPQLALKMGSKGTAKQILKSSDDLLKASAKYADEGAEALGKVGLENAKNLEKLNKSIGAGNYDEFIKSTNKNILRESTVNKMLKSTTYGKVGKAIDITAFSIRTGTFEAGLEARTNFNEAFDTYIEAFRKENGRFPSVEELGNFTGDATNSANNLFAANMAILAPSNLAMYGKLSGIGAKISTKYNNYANKLVGKGVTFSEKEGVKVATAIAPTKLQKNLGRFQGIFGKAATEGLYEEGFQGVAGKTMQNYLEAKYDPKAIGREVDVWASLYKSFGEQYGTNEGWKEMFIGSLIGGIGAPALISSTQGKPGDVVKNVIENITQAGVAESNKALADQHNKGHVDIQSRLSSASALINSVNKQHALTEGFDYETGSKKGIKIDFNEAAKQEANANYDYISTVTGIKSDSEIIEDYDFYVENMQLSEEIQKETGLDEVQFGEYQSELKEQFRNQLKLARKAKSAAEALGIPAYVTEDGNSREVTDVLARTLYEGMAIAPASQVLAKQLDTVLGKQGLLGSMTFLNNLTEEQKGLVDEFSTLKEDIALSEKLALEYQQVLNEQAARTADVAKRLAGKNPSAIAVSETALRNKREKQQLNSEKLVKLRGEIDAKNRRLETIKETLQTAKNQNTVELSNTFGVTSDGLVGYDIEQVLAEVSEIDNYVTSLRKAGKSREANVIEKMTDDLIASITKQRNLEQLHREMLDPSFFKRKKGKTLISDIIGKKYKVSDDLKKKLDENSDRILSVMAERSGMVYNKTLSEYAKEKIENNPKLSEREKFRIEAILKAQMMQMNILNNTLAAESVSETGGVKPTTYVKEGDTVEFSRSLDTQQEGLNNAEQLDTLIKTILNEINGIFADDTVTDVQDEETLKEIEELEKAIKEHESKITEKTSPEAEATLRKRNLEINKTYSAEEFLNKLQPRGAAKTKWQVYKGLMSALGVTVEISNRVDYQRNGYTAAGYYTGGENKVYMSTNILSDSFFDQVAMHELFHALTSATIYSIEGVVGFEDVITVTEAQKKAYENLQKLRNEILTSKTKSDGFNKGENTYGLKNIKEMMSELVNPAFVKGLNSFKKGAFLSGNTGYDYLMEQLTALIADTNMDEFRALKNWGSDALVTQEEHTKNEENKARLEELQNQKKVETEEVAREITTEDIKGLEAKHNVSITKNEDGTYAITAKSESLLDGATTQQTTTTPTTEEVNKEYDSKISEENKELEAKKKELEDKKQEELAKVPETAEELSTDNVGVAIHGTGDGKTDFTKSDLIKNTPDLRDQRALVTLANGEQKVVEKDKDNFFVDDTGETNLVTYAKRDRSDSFGRLGYYGVTVSVPKSADLAKVKAIMSSNIQAEKEDGVSKISQESHDNTAKKIQDEIIALSAANENATTKEEITKRYDAEISKTEKQAKENITKLEEGRKKELSTTSKQTQTTTPTPSKTKASTEIKALDKVTTEEELDTLLDKYTKDNKVTPESGIIDFVAKKREQLKNNKTKEATAEKELDNLSKLTETKEVVKPLTIKLLSNQEFNRLQDLIAKNEVEELTEEEELELEQLKNDFDRWTLIDGIVIDGVRLSDLIRRKILYDTLGTQVFEETFNIDAYEYLQLSEFNSRSKDNYYGLLQSPVNATVIKDYKTGKVSIQNVSAGELAKLMGATVTEQDPDPNTQVSFEVAGENGVISEIVANVNQQGNLLFTEEDIKIINDNTSLIISPTNEKLKTRYSVLLQQKGDAIIPVSSDYTHTDFEGKKKEAINEDAIYKLKAGDKLTIVVDPKDDYNKKLLDRVTNNSIPTEEEINKEVKKRLKNNQVYQDALFQIENAPGLDIVPTQEAIVIRDKIEGKMREQVIDKLTKTVIDTVSEESMELLVDNMVIKMFTDGGELVGIMKANRATDGKTTTDLKYEKAREFIVRSINMKLMDKSQDSIILDEVEAVTTGLYLGHPNYTFVKDSEGNLGTEYKDLTQSDLKHVVDIGFTQGKNLSLKNDTKNVDFTYLEKFKDNKRRAVVVLDVNGRKVAYPVNVKQMDMSNLVEELESVLYSKLPAIEKGIRADKILAELGVNPNTRGNSLEYFSADNNTFNEENYQLLLDRVKNKPYLYNITDWITDSTTMEDVLLSQVQVNIDLSRPFHSPKIKFDFPGIEITPDTLTAADKSKLNKKTGKRSVTPSLDTITATDTLLGARSCKG